MPSWLKCNKAMVQRAIGAPVQPLRCGTITGSILQTKVEACESWGRFFFLVSCSLPVHAVHLINTKRSEPMNNSHAQSVLDHWFGAPGDAEHGQHRDMWFRKSEATDQAIRQKFGPLIEQALRGELQSWSNEFHSALALIVVLDQFTRNVHRDTPRAFAGDVQALSAAQAMVRQGQDLQLLPVQRVFVYLPFEHAEDLALQDESVRLFTALADESASAQNILDYAHRHRDIIAKFGRFPHRNEVLGRVSSAEELAFLELPGSRF